MDDALLLQKYHGLGNDYLVLDPNKNKIHLLERHIVKLCRRNIGAGADGILYGPIWQDEKLYVKIFNPDGSEAEGPTAKPLTAPPAPLLRLKAQVPRGARSRTRRDS